MYRGSVHAARLSCGSSLSELRPSALFTDTTDSANMGASSLTFEADSDIFLLQLAAQVLMSPSHLLQPDGYRLSWRLVKRLCLQMTPGSPDDFPYSCRPGSITLPGEDGSPLVQLLLHQLITASGCQLCTGTRLV
ncbi:hypothetical protein NQZ68_034870 [Dissostichus eleginoides]|nr:hypothetical protein NQZ68_034870 [Dissostichus eleginoides]